jgi:glycosyltransferase involved in cell wall biosynthesis
MTKKIEKLSIVMAVHDNAEQIERNLPLFLTQQSERTVEVIVVNDASADDTPDVLKRLKKDYPNLYTTFIPTAPINPRRHRLALSVGAKAAKGEWIILADINCPPLSENSLEQFVATIEETDCELAMAFVSPRKDHAVSYKLWDRVEEAATWLRKAERRGGCGHKGHWMKMRRGLYDAVAVPKERIHDTLYYFDEAVHGCRLAGLRLKIWLTI